MIPTNAFEGDNIATKSTKMGFYKGPILYEALDYFKLPPKPTDKPLRLPIQDVYTITGVGTVPVGRVETGVLKVGDKVVFNPSGSKGDVKTIEMHHEKFDKAEPGDNIGFNVRGVGKNDVHRGDVCGLESKPPTIVKEFTAKIAILQHPTAVTAGYTPVFHTHTAQIACTVTEIIEKIDPKTGQVLEKNPDFIKKGDMATIKIVPTKPMVIEKVSEIPQMARFAIRDMGMTVGAGVCVDLVKK